MQKSTKPGNVEEYIATVPPEGENHLKEMRAILKAIAPDAEEKLKWGVPVLEQGTILFAYAAHAKHINLVPTGPALEPFLGELGDYKTNKDSVQFLYAQPLPKDLIQRIAAHRLKDVVENGAKWKY